MRVATHESYTEQHAHTAVRPKIGPSVRESPEVSISIVTGAPRQFSRPLEFFFSPEEVDQNTPEVTKKLPVTVPPELDGLPLCHFGRRHCTAASNPGAARRNGTRRAPRDGSGEVRPLS